MTAHQRAGGFGPVRLRAEEVIGLVGGEAALPAAKDEVDPLVQVRGDVLAFEREK